MSLVHLSRTSLIAYEGKKLPVARWVRATLEYEIYPAQAPHGQVRRRSKVNVALLRKGRVQTVIPKVVWSNVKSPANWFDIEPSRDAGFEMSRRRSSARRSRPFDALTGREWVALLKRRDRRAARLQGCQFSRALVRGLAPTPECCGPSTFRAPGASSGKSFRPPGRQPGRSCNSDRSRPLSGSSDADQTRPPVDQPRVAIEATKSRLRAGRIGSCLSDCLARDVSFDRRWPGQ